MEKAVITGMGIVSPAGTSLADFEQNLFAGRHGITEIEHFDTSDMGVRSMTTACTASSRPSRLWRTRASSAPSTRSAWG